MAGFPPTPHPQSCFAPLRGVGGDPAGHGERKRKAAQRCLRHEEQRGQRVAPVGQAPLCRQRPQPPHLLLQQTGGGRGVCVHMSVRLGGTPPLIMGAGWARSEASAPQQHAPGHEP